MNMADEYKPFYQHLTHHSVWDKAANERTTHEDLIRAMRLAGVGAGAITLSEMMRSRPREE